MYELKLKHHFSAAHQLKNAYSKECNDSIHGHNWKVGIIVRTDKLYNSMVIDFKLIKEIINKLDHKNLNDILDFETTAENLSKYIKDQIQFEIDKMEIERNVEVEIEVFEVDNASIRYYE